MVDMKNPNPSLEKRFYLQAMFNQSLIKEFDKEHQMFSLSSVLLVQNLSFLLWLRLMIWQIALIWRSSSNLEVKKFVSDRLGDNGTPVTNLIVALK